MKQSSVCAGACILLFLATASPPNCQAWGGGGGPLIVRLTPDLGELNDELAPLVGRFEEGVWMIGGGGFVGVHRNLRLGGLGAQGSTKIEDGEREAELTMSYGGLLAECAVPYKRIQCFVGGVIGWGTMGLELSRKNRFMNWHDFWSNFGDEDISSDDFTGHLSTSFFFYQPYVGVQLAVSPSVHLRGSIGYFGASIGSGHWKESGTTLGGSPSIDISNWRLQLSMLFGSFPR